MDPARSQAHTRRVRLLDLSTWTLPRCSPGAAGPLMMSPRFCSNLLGLDKRRRTAHDERDAGECVCSGVGHETRELRRSDNLVEGLGHHSIHSLHDSGTLDGPACDESPYPMAATPPRPPTMQIADGVCESEPW